MNEILICYDGRVVPVNSTDLAKLEAAGMVRDHEELNERNDGKDYYTLRGNTTWDDIEGLIGVR